MFLACASAAAAPAPVESRIAAQNALFDEEYEAALKAHPERATAFGDYRYNDRLGDYSLAGLSREHASDESFLARLKAISTAGFPEQDALSHEVLRSSLEQRIRNYEFKEFEMPVNQLDGPQVRLADLPLAVPFDSVQQYEDYIARLHQIPRVFTQTEEVLRAGMADNLMPVRFLLEKIARAMPGDHRGRPVSAADQAFSSEHRSGGPAASCQSDQRRGRRRCSAGLHLLCKLHGHRVRPARSRHAHRNVAARRCAALSQRHQEPDHREQAHSGRDPPDRPARD
jgi:uncharacterized protein (DUF885 family)